MLKLTTDKQANKQTGQKPYALDHSIQGYNKSRQKTTMFAGQQLSLNNSQGLSFSKVGQISRSQSQKLW